LSKQVVLIQIIYDLLSKKQENSYDLMAVPMKALMKLICRFHMCR